MQDTFQISLDFYFERLFAIIESMGVIYHRGDGNINSQAGFRLFPINP